MSDEAFWGVAITASVLVVYVPIFIANLVGTAPLGKNQARVLIVCMMVILVGGVYFGTIIQDSSTRQVKVSETQAIRSQETRATLDTKHEGHALPSGELICIWRINVRFDNQSKTEPMKIEKVSLLVHRAGAIHELTPIDDAIRRTFETDIAIGSGGFLTMENVQLQPLEQISTRLVFLDSHEALISTNSVTLRVVANGNTQEITFGDF